MQILYVENNARFAKLAIAQFLSSHEVTLVSSLAQARTFLSQNSIAIVLIDYDLDDGKGDELVRELKLQSNCPRIIAVSAHQNGNEALLNAGADAVCGKMQFSNIAAMLSTVVL